MLPGLDDGAIDEAATENMASAYLEAEVRNVVATPHIRPGMFENDERHLRSIYLRTRDVLQESFPELNLRIGAEYFWDSELMEKLKHPQDLLTLADGGRYLLVEFNSMAAPIRLREIIFELKLKGITLVMAHPERYAFIAEDMDYTENLVGAGMLMQGTLASLAGLWGGRTRKTLKRLLDAQLIHLISTDAHSARDVTVYLEALERLRKWVGPYRAELLIEENPGKIIKGEPVL